MKIEGRIHAPRFSDEIKKKMIEDLVGKLVDYEFNDNIILGSVIDAYLKDDEIWGDIDFNDKYTEYVEKGLKDGSLGYSIGYIKYSDKDGNIKKIIPRQVAILPREMIPTPECTECKIKGDDE